MCRHEPADVCTQLLLRAQEGDAQAFAELYATLSPVVKGFLASLNGKLSGDDLVQETFLRVWKNRSCYRGDASAKTFVLAVAKKVAFKHLAERRQITVVCVGDLSRFPGRRDPAERSHSTGTSQDELLQAVQQAVARLPDAQRQAVEFHLSHNSRAAAARAANCSPCQFADRLYRAKNRLRQILSREL